MKGTSLVGYRKLHEALHLMSDSWESLKGLFSSSIDGIFATGAYTVQVDISMVYT